MRQLQDRYGRYGRFVLPLPGFRALRPFVRAPPHLSVGDAAASVDAHRLRMLAIFYR